ncbi:TetR/AcrR family transcriptional regulator [Sphingobium yanoikuyae]|uniref:TetR/AcrR family transcriptional regulator n=1 Tax=Sphingobium yanoikuyae TaxID=13690 RepID=A0A9X7U7R1_SPHYA|nr:TetR/AcrR family transcriptional regulator [Sphingobium yanoikuyae]QNG43459.1 TetR/AcrR family transcriptional regulator [Sphingobium yanoikuyae]
MEAQNDETQRKPGRPRSLDRDVQIREAAWQLIADLGCGALTFEAIAQAAGCSRSTLYRRFPSKAELILHLLDETARAFAPGFAINAPPREKLLAHANTLVKIYRDYRGVAFIHMFAASRSDKAIADAIGAHAAFVLPHYCEPLRALVPSASEDVIHFAVRTLIGSVIYHVAARGDPASEQELDRLVGAAIYMAQSEPV